MVTKYGAFSIVLQILQKDCGCNVNEEDLPETKRLVEIAGLNFDQLSSRCFEYTARRLVLNNRQSATIGDLINHFLRRGTCF